MKYVFVIQALLIGLKIFGMIDLWLIALLPLWIVVGGGWLFVTIVYTSASLKQIGNIFNIR